MKGQAQRRRSSRRTQGFTLLELMVALTVGGIAITSIYAIGAASTRVFHQQHQLATAQTALRLAVNQVKRDLARAGYLATPGLDLPGQACQPIPNVIHDPLGSGRLAAISIFRNDVATDSSSGRSAVDPTGNNRANGFTVDDIVLMGNYETASEYAGASLTLGNPAEVSVGRNWYAFHRDFTNWYTGDPLAPDWNAFRRAFNPGRMIRIRMASGLLHFSTIRGVTEPIGVQEPRITFDTAVPADCAVNGTGAWIAPISTIHYFVRNAPATERAADADRTSGPMAQLIREEVRPGDKATPLFATVNGRGAGTRVILDYVVGFNLEFTSTAGTGPNQPDQYFPGASQPQAPDNDDADPPTAAEMAAAADALNLNPERARSAVIDIAVRTPDPDPTFPWVMPNGQNCTRLRCFQVFAPIGNPATTPAARVRRMRAEVFLPNIANEGY